MTPEEHYIEAERLAVEADATMREAPREGDGQSYKDRRSARLIQLAKLHAALAGVPRETAALAARLPAAVKPRRPLAGGAVASGAMTLEQVAAGIEARADRPAFAPGGQVGHGPRPRPVVVFKPERPPTGESGVSRGPDGRR